METYQFDDGEFQFFTAGRKGASYVIIYRVRLDNWPEKRAREKNIKFDYIRRSSAKEVKRWLQTHHDYPVREVRAEGLYWTGGTDCGVPDCPEHAYLKNG